MCCPLHHTQTLSSRLRIPSRQRCNTKGIGVGDGRGQGALCSPQTFFFFADVRIRANFGRIFRAKMGPNSFFFSRLCVPCVCCSTIIFAEISCRISCTPKPVLKYRTVSGAVKKKGARVPPPPPPPPPPSSPMYRFCLL